MTKPTLCSDQDTARSIVHLRIPRLRRDIQFREGPIFGLVLTPLRRWRDGRGWLIELWRHDELDPEYHPAMTYVSQTLPGVARGPHAHRDQADLFGFFGPGDFRLYVWDSRPESPSFGNRQAVLVGESNPTAVLVPAGVVHGYKNVSDVAGLVFNGPNRLYAGYGRTEPVDEIRYEDLPNHPYLME